MLWLLLQCIRVADDGLSGEAWRLLCLVAAFEGYELGSPTHKHLTDIVGDEVQPHLHELASREYITPFKVDGQTAYTLAKSFIANASQLADRQLAQLAIVSSLARQPAKLLAKPANYHEPASSGIAKDHSYQQLALAPGESFDRFSHQPSQPAERIVSDNEEGRQRVAHENGLSRLFDDLLHGSYERLYFSTGKDEPEISEKPWDVLMALMEVNPNISRGHTLATAKKLIAQGYTVAQIKGCAEHLAASEFYISKRIAVTASAIANRIATWVEETQGVGEVVHSDDGGLHL